MSAAVTSHKQSQMTVTGVKKGVCGAKSMLWGIKYFKSHRIRTIIQEFSKRQHILLCRLRERIPNLSLLLWSSLCPELLYPSPDIPTALFYGQWRWFILWCKLFFYIVPTAHENPKTIIKHHDHPLVQKRQVSFKEIFWRLPKKISVHSPLPVSSAFYVFPRALWESLIYFPSSSHHNHASFLM